MARRRCLFGSYFYVKYNGASYDGTLTIPSFDATGGTAQIEVISYKPWNLKSKPAWITMSTESGNRGKTLVTLTANTNSGSLRSGAIDIAPNTEKYKVSINVAQNSSSPTEYYFYFGNSGTATSTATTVESAVTTASFTYRTNYENLASSTTANWITSVTFSNGTLVVGFNVNDTISDRTGTITIKGNGSNVATITITQKAIAYFNWGNTPGTTPTATTATSVSYQAGSVQTFYRTNYTGLTVTPESTYSWVDSYSLSNPDGNGTFKIDYQANGTTDVKTAVYDVKVGSAVIGKFTFNHQGTYTLSVTPTSSTVAATGGNIILFVTSNQAWSASSNQNWATLNTTAGTNNGQVTVTIPNYTVQSERSVTIIFAGQHGQTCTVTIQQQAYVPPTSPYEIHAYFGNGNNYTYSAGTSNTGNTAARVITVNQDWTYDADEWITVTPSTGGDGTTSVTVSWGDNSGGQERTGTITFYGSEGSQSALFEGYDYIELYQPAGATPPTTSLDAYFGSQGTTSTTVNSGASYVTATVVAEGQRWGVDSMSDGIVSVNPSTGNAGTTSVTINYSENPYGFSRENTVVLTGNSGGSITLKITQNKNKDIPDGWAWFMCYVENGDNETATIGTGTPVEIWAKYADSNFDVHTLTSIAASDWVYEGTNTSCSDVSKSGSKFYFESDVTGTTDLQAKYNGYRTSNYVSIEVTGSTPPPVEEFLWDNDETAKTISLAWDDTSISEDYTLANMTLSSTVGANPAASWITSKRLSNRTADGRFTATVGLFTSGTSGNSPRTTTLEVKKTDSTVVGVLYVSQTKQPQAPVKTLTAITFQINSAPTIPAGGGSVDCSDITDYVIMAYYSDNTSDDVTDDTAHQNIVDCSGVTASSRGTVTGNTIPVGTLEMRMSYTEDGVTVDDYDSYVISQNANRLTETGITHSEKDKRTIYSGRTDITYETTITPNGETVGSTGTTTTFQVFAEKISTPYTITTTTWTNVDTPYSAYTSGEKANGRPVETPGSSTSETPGTPSSEEVEPVYLRTDDVVGGVFVSNVQKLPDAGSERNYWRATYPQNSTSSMRTNHIIFAATIDGEAQKYFTLSQDGSSAPVITRTITVEPKNTFTLRAIGRPTTALSDSSFTLVGMGGTGSISYAASSYDSTNNVMTYTSQGSIVFNNVSTAATAVSVGFAEIDLNFNGYFNGLAGQSSFGGMGFDVSGGGTSIDVGGTYFVDIPVSAGSSDTTVYVVNLPPTPTANYTAS